MKYLYHKNLTGRAMLILIPDEASSVGAIVERGDREALLQKKRKYYALYVTQFD